MEIIDLTGQKFNRLTAICLSPKPTSKRTFWLCKCDCGNDHVVESQKLKRGSTKSCGCWRTEVRKSAKGHGEAVGKISTEFGIWRQMVGRCNCTTSKAYFYYGARGIRLCERWLDVRNFISDMGRRPSPKHSIERRDNDGNYEPSNCYWATKKEQANNRRSNVIVTLNGESHNIVQWSEKLGISANVLYSRIQVLKWSPERALTTAVKHPKF